MTQPFAPSHSMTFPQATARCLRQSLRFVGRASRSEYWKFLPVGLMLPALAIAAARLAGLSGWASISVGLITLVPLIAVTSRRALDGGETPIATLRPAGHVVAFLGTLWLGSTTGAYLLSLANEADGPIGFAIAIVMWATFAVTFFVAFRFFLTGLIRGAALFSQMAEPSQPGPNAYGPNPFEVQQ